MAGLAASYLLFALGLIFLLIAGFVWIATHYGADAAFLAVGLTLVFTATIFMVLAKYKRKAKPPLPNAIVSDPLAAHIPASLRENPVVQKLLLHIAENPVAATATAVTLGMLISNELFDESQ